MRCSTHQHPFYCGSDLHARSMYVCILSPEGAMRVHRNMKAVPAPFLPVIAPYRDGLVIAVDCLFTWYGLADLGAPDQSPFVLGHALSMKAMHGGQSQKMAPLRRGGRRPHASVSPAARRTPRALVRRRPPLRRTRAALFAHRHHTNRQYPQPELGQHMADTAHRAGGAERFHAAAVHKTLAGALDLIPSSDALLQALALSLLTPAKHHEATPLALWPPLPGLGTLLRLVVRYDRHAIHRLPRRQDVASDGRLGTCRKASGGKRVGTAGNQRGKAPRPGAFADAAPLFLRHHEAGQT